MTLKAMRHAATMRSILNQIGKSPRHTERQRRQHKEYVRHDLEQSLLIYPASFAAIGLRPDMTFSERKEALGLSPYTKEPTKAEKDLTKFLAEGAETSRQANWRWRIGAAAEEFQRDGWYPFFVTLTVDPLLCDPKSLWTAGVAWRKYKRALCDTVTQAMGVPYARNSKVPEAEYVQYVGLIEHGKSREHHHMHLLLWLREIPDSWKRCPNSGIRDPQRRIRQRCLQLETLWPHSLPGLSHAKYFRTVGDIWQKLGFCTPMHQGRPLRLSPPFKAGSYVTKYMIKDFKVWTHRVKATRNIGILTLKRRIEMMNAPRVEALTWRAETYRMNTSLQTIHSVPLGLIRSIAKQVLFCKRWESKTLNWDKELQSNYNVYSAMALSVNNGENPRMMSSEDYYAWLQKHLPDQDGYCERRQRRAHQALRYLFPKIRHKTIEPIGGNRNGLTHGV